MRAEITIERASKARSHDMMSAVANMGSLVIVVSVPLGLGGSSFNRRAPGW